MRNALELSTTTQPALAAMGANSLEIAPPALKSAMSIPANEFLDRNLLAAKWQRFAGRTRRGQQRQLADWKIALLQSFDHLHSDRAGGADDDNIRF
jgi:hypothetical protein